MKLRVEKATASEMKANCGWKMIAKEHPDRSAEVLKLHELSWADAGKLRNKIILVLYLIVLIVLSHCCKGTIGILLLLERVSQNSLTVLHGWRLEVKPERRKASSWWIKQEENKGIRRKEGTYHVRGKVSKLWERNSLKRRRFLERSYPFHYGKRRVFIIGTAIGTQADKSSARAVVRTSFQNVVFVRIVFRIVTVILLAFIVLCIHLLEVRRA